MTPDRNDIVDAALWMLAQLSPQTLTGVRRRLAIRLTPTSSPREHRLRDLGFVAELLRSSTSSLDGVSPYVARELYDAERPADSLSSRALVERYGSWVVVCKHAHRLTTHPYERVLPVPQSQDPSKLGRRYSNRNIADALRECARELGRTPSSNAYAAWYPAAGRRRSGFAGYPSDRTIGRRFAYQGGWLAALEHAELIVPPTMTVRVVGHTAEEARQLETAMRAAGFVAAKAGNRNWIEVRATLAEVGRAIIGHPESLAGALTFWEPQTRTLERADSNWRIAHCDAMCPRAARRPSVMPDLEHGRPDRTCGGRHTDDANRAGVK